MALKILRTIIQDYMGCQDVDIVYGSHADALLVGVKDHRMELLRELKRCESHGMKSLESELRGMGLPKYIPAQDFMATIRTLAVLEKS